MEARVDRGCMMLHCHSEWLHRSQRSCRREVACTSDLNAGQTQLCCHANGDNKPALPRLVQSRTKIAWQNFQGVQSGEHTEWKDLLVVEIFAGTARFSRAFAQRDFRVSSVDHTSRRSTGLITILALTKDDDLNFY